MSHPFPAAESSLPPDRAETDVTGLIQDFPARGPAAVQTEKTRLADLVHHREAVSSEMTLEQCYQIFRERKTDYLAVVRDARVVGLCSRGQIGFILGSRFGFSIYSQNPIETALVPAPLIVSTATSIREILDRSLARTGEAFHQDAVLVDDRDGLIGLIKAETLAQLQSRLVTEQLEALRDQHGVVRRQNLELFRAGHAVRQSQGLYLGLFASHALGIALLGPGGEVQEHNRRLGELLGLPGPATSIVSLQAWVDEKERPAFLELLRRQSTTEAGTGTIELTLHLPGRGTRVFRCTTGWIRETGQICACLDDITEQRAFERNALLHEKQIMLETLVGGIAHELNNKLTPVQGFAELLMLDLPAPANTHAQYIQKSVGEAAHIIRQLLQLSKPVQPDNQTVDLRDVVEETLAVLQFEIRSSCAQIVTELPPEPVGIVGDPGQLKQVVLNILLNAIQACDTSRRPEIRVILRTDRPKAELLVMDNGRGIAEDVLPRVFDPFFTTKGPEKGTGLGLSVCYSIVRRHGGEIVAESPPGTGACFTVRLPLDSFGVACHPVVPEAGAGSGSPDSGLVRGRRILVVDDDEVIGFLLREMLVTSLAAEVEVVPSGMQALRHLDRNDYDLVISDIQMPEMSGIELYRHLVATRPAIAARFIFITGYSGSQDLKQRIAAWKVPVIAKPFTLPRLVEVCTSTILNAAGPGTASAREA